MDRLKGSGLAILLGSLLVFASAEYAQSAQTQTVPSILKEADQTRSAILKKFSPAVVGLVCKGPYANGKFGGYYGTGAVITAKGLILTNTSVIPNGSKDVKVYFTDGRVRPAEILHIDMKTEGVLIKVEETDLVHMKLADSKQTDQPLFLIY